MLKMIKTQRGNEVFIVWRSTHPLFFHAPMNQTGHSAHVIRLEVSRNLNVRTLSRCHAALKILLFYASSQGAENEQICHPRSMWVHEKIGHAFLIGDRQTMAKYWRIFDRFSKQKSRFH